MLRQVDISNRYMKILKKYNLEVTNLTGAEIKAREEHFKQGGNLLKTALVSGGVISLCFDLLLGTDISVPLIIYSLVSSEVITCSLACCKMGLSGGLKQAFNKEKQELHFEKEILNRISAEFARAKARVLEQVLNFTSRLEAGDALDSNNKISVFFYKFYREKFNIGVIDAEQLAKEVYGGLSKAELLTKKTKIDDAIQAAYSKLEAVVASKVLLKEFRFVFKKSDDRSSASLANLERIIEKICFKDGFDLASFYDICSSDLKSIRSQEAEISRELLDLECDLFLLECVLGSSDNKGDGSKGKDNCATLQRPVGNSAGLKASESPVAGPVILRGRRPETGNRTCK